MIAATSGLPLSPPRARPVVVVARTKTPFPCWPTMRPSRRRSFSASRTTVFDTPYISRSWVIDGSCAPTASTPPSIFERRSAATCRYAGVPDMSAIQLRLSSRQPDVLSTAHLVPASHLTYYPCYAYHAADAASPA